MSQVRNIDKQERIQAVYDANPGLKDAFDSCGNLEIVQNIHWALRTYGRLSEKQIAVVLNINAKRKQFAETPYVNAPVFNGRTEVTGTVLATKSQVGFGYPAGVVYKMLVSVEGDDGNYKAWGTIPASIMHDLDKIVGHMAQISDLRGRKVGFEAKFTVADNDPTMTFFSRPTNGVIFKENE